MRVALLGEFSSLHRNLKEGLIKCGIDEVSLFSSGDGWKKIGGENTRLPEIAEFNSRLTYYRRFFDVIKTIKGYDVVQLICSTVFPPAIGSVCVDLLRKNNRVLSLVAAGSDYTLVKAYNDGKFDYFPYDYDKSVLKQFSNKTLRGKLLIHNAVNIEKKVDVIIPSLYEYKVGYEGKEKVTDVIPFPLNVDAIPYSPNVVKDKIVFFHGLNRELSKGTPIIKEALNCLERSFPNDVEVIIEGHLPYNEYISLMMKTNVVIDQCCSYGYGINACIAMAQGKIVLSGARKETLNSFGLSMSPIVHVKPDAEYLFEQLSKIVLNRDSIPKKGLESREYVEKVHNYELVARKYLDSWERVI